MDILKLLSNSVKFKFVEGQLEWIKHSKVGWESHIGSIQKGFLGTEMLKFGLVSRIKGQWSE